MAHIDLVALQQRLAQQPKAVPAEPPSWSTRPAPTSGGTLRATTTMRAALPSEVKSARAVRAEERARATALRAQIDELNAELVATRIEANLTLAEERHRADLLTDRVDAVQRDLDAVRAQAARTADRAERALTGERQRADALRERLDNVQRDLMASEAIASELRANLNAARAQVQATQEVADAQARLLAACLSRGPLARLRAAWRGEKS
jgi:chromosome segregation ATPase